MEFLRQKWSIWFDLLDVNHDGNLTRADVELTLTNFPKVEGLTESEGKLADEKIEKWWNTYILKGKEKVTKEEFVQDLEIQNTSDKDSFISTIRACAGDIIDVIDADKTGDISLDNYVKAFKVWGHDNEASIRKSFEIYRPDHEKVSDEEYTNDWVIFLTNEDPEKTDVVLETFKAGLI